MFDDHFTVESPGILPGLVRISNIRDFHFSRNPLNVELLNEYDYVKEYGEGVDRVYKDMEKAGLPEPEYRQSEFMLSATLKNKNWGKKDATWNDYPLGDKPGDNQGTNNESYEEFEVRALKAKEILRIEPGLSITALAQRMGISRKQAEYALDMLKERNTIHREGTNRKGRWVIDD
jgi:ATP-dependent DNA helicase RecG